jgi:hypothetical protein
MTGIAKTISGFVLAAAMVTTVVAWDSKADGPRYTAEGQLIRPLDYREWVFLSAGLGMSYTQAAPRADPLFDNVFVDRTAYRAFLDTGRWPDKTVMLLELRNSRSQESINVGGRFQSGVAALEAHVKDEARFPGKWAFFRFEGSQPSGKLIPQTADCYSCHLEHGVVDTTFVQFYPVLLDVAKAKGTVH